MLLVDLWGRARRCENAPRLGTGGTTRATQLRGDIVDTSRTGRTVPLLHFRCYRLQVDGVRRQRHTVPRSSLLSEGRKDLNLFGPGQNVDR